MKARAFLFALSFLLSPCLAQDSDKTSEGKSSEGGKKEDAPKAKPKDGAKKAVVSGDGVQKVDNPAADPVEGLEDKSDEGAKPGAETGSAVGPSEGPRENKVVRPQEFPAIVAVVGDSSISRRELEQEFSRLSEEYRTQLSARVEPVDMTNVVRSALQSLVDHQLLLQASKRLVGDRDLKEIIPVEKVYEEVDRRVEDLKKAGYRQFSSREDYFTNQLKQFGLSREKVIEGMRERILVNHYLWQEVFRDVGAYVRPSESRAYYRSHLSEFTEPLGYSYRRIEFGQDAESTALAREIQQALERGEDFVELARQHSEEFSRGSKNNGRLWEKTAEQVKSLAFPIPQILTRMQAGQNLGPFRIQGKVVFFRLESVEEGAPLPYEQAQLTIERKLLGQQREARTQSLLTKLRAQTRIESYVNGVEVRGQTRGGAAEGGKVSAGVSEREEKVVDGTTNNDAAQPAAGARGNAASGDRTPRAAKD